MNLRNPVNSVVSAMHHALERGLVGVPSPEATMLLGPSPEGMRRRRPNADECNVVMFEQTWRARDVGFSQGRANESLQGETVVVTGPEGDACVYFASQLVYHVREPNRRFFLDVAAQSMAACTDAAAYDGHGNTPLEKLDYGFEAELARRCTTAKFEDAEHAHMMAGLLREYADRFEHVALTAARSMPADAPPERLVA
jgi:hypothetical protein